MFQSQNSHLWNTECVKSVALEGGLIFRRSLAWDEVLQPACCCFELPCRARSFSDGSRASFAGLNTAYPEWKTAFFEGNQKKILSSPERIGFHSVATVWFSFHWLFWLLRKKKVSTWLTILPAPWFQVRLEFFSPSSTLQADVNGWFIL